MVTKEDRLSLGLCLPECTVLTLDPFTDPTPTKELRRSDSKLRCPQSAGLGTSPQSLSSQKENVTASPTCSHGRSSRSQHVQEVTNKKRLQLSLWSANYNLNNKLKGFYSLKGPKKRSWPQVYLWGSVCRAKWTLMPGPPASLPSSSTPALWSARGLDWFLIHHLKVCYFRGVLCTQKLLIPRSVNFQCYIKIRLTRKDKYQFSIPPFNFWV